MSTDTLGFYGGATLNASQLPNLSEMEIVGAANGTFVAIWVDSSGIGTDTSGSGLVVQIFDALGRPLIPEGQANTLSTFGNQSEVDLIAMSDGGAAFVYTTEFSSTDRDIIYERRDAQGVVVNRAVIDNSLADERSAAITEFGNNGLFVVYEDSTSGGVTSIRGRTADAAGNVSGEIIIDQQSDNNLGPAIATLNNGNAVIAYENEVSLNGSSVVRYTLVTQALGLAGFADITSPDNISNVDVAAIANGGFVLTWQETDTSGIDQVYFSV
ncbi:MAG: hypothetical protein AAFY53_02000 [Pseudomonadota bacterium]